MEDAWSRDPSRCQALHPVPVRTVALASAQKRVMPRSHNLGSESFEATDVCGDGVVRKVAADHGLDHLPLHGHGQMALPMEILANPLQLYSHSFLRGASVEQELPRSRLPADVRETEKVEGFRLSLPAFATIRCSTAAEPDQSRFV